MSVDARYNDGTDASVHRVRIEIANGTLTVTGETARADWRLDDVHVIDGGDGDRPLRLGCRAAPDARLTIADPQDAQAIRAALPERGRGPRAWSATRIAGYFAGAAALLALLVFALPHAVHLVAALIPLSAEERLGTNVRNQIVGIFALADKSRLPVCTHGAGDAVLARLTQRLVAKTQTPLNFRVEVIRAPVVNAVSLPGGRILIFSELFKKAANADEVAGVLAHEIGHGLRRHAIESLIAEKGLTMIAGALVGFSTTFSSLGETLIASSFSRAAETEADEVAADLLQGAGLRATGLASFFAGLSAQEKSLPEFLVYFSSHPRSEERAKRANARGTEGAEAFSMAELNLLRHMCD